MTKARVQQWSKPNAYVVVDTAATVGATVGVDLYWPDGRVVTAADLTAGTTGTVTIRTTDRLFEGRYNLYFTDERVDDRVAQLLVEGDDISLAYDDDGNTLTISSTAGTFQSIASGTVSALRVLSSGDGTVSHADPSVLGDGLLCCGVSVTAANDTEALTVRSDGVMVDGGWTWAPGVIWCGAAGVLTQTAPTSGWLMEVGRALNATTAVIDLQTPYWRN